MHAFLKSLSNHADLMLARAIKDRKEERGERERGRERERRERERAGRQCCMG
jgi:hypothetical protein